MAEPDDARKIWSYDGRVEVRPLGRGITLDDLSPGELRHLEDTVPEGRYIARLTFEPVSETQYHLSAPANLRRLLPAVDQLERGEDLTEFEPDEI